MTYPLLNSRRWTRPDNYIGYNPEGDVCLYARTRDGDTLDQSNFACFTALLRRLDPQELHFYTWSASHWACGWIEYLMLKDDAPSELKQLAEDTVAALADYPILDENDYSDREYEYATEVWRDGYSVRERAKLIKEYGEGTSLFQARHDRLPDDPSGQIYAALTVR